VARVKTGLGEAQKEAQKGLQQLEASAQQALATLTARVQTSREGVKGLLQKLEGVELRSEAALEAVTKRVAEVQEAARKQLEGVPTRLVEGAGIATHQQVRALQQEVAELSRKLDAALAGSKKQGKSEGRAA
jgi:hypothetical protein